jgi:glycosyltransferase involved in cell wall biosynthesis
MSEVRVVHTVPALFGTDGVLGGAERYVLELARHMAERVPTRLVTFGDRSQVQQRDALEVRVIGTPWLVRGERFNPMSRRLFSELRWATVIHCHQQHILASSVAALFGRLTRRRVFVTDLGGGGWDISAYLSTDRWYQDKPWARVILGGVDSEKFSPSPAVPRKRQALFVGRLLPHKGLDYLIEGMPSDIALKVVGPRGEERYWEDLERLARGKSVEFAHTLNDDGLVQASDTPRGNGLRDTRRDHRGREPAGSRGRRHHGLRGPAKRCHGTGTKDPVAGRLPRGEPGHGRRSTTASARTIHLAGGGGSVLGSVSGAPMKNGVRYRHG